MEASIDKPWQSAYAEKEKKKNSFFNIFISGDLNRTVALVRFFFRCLYAVYVPEFSGFFSPNLYQSSYIL